MANKTIEVERRDEACIITLNRPDKKNAFNLAMKHEVMAALREAGADPSVRAVVITGGEQFFSAGQDLNEALAADKPAQIWEMLNSWHALNDAMEQLGKPVLAAIEGFCITGGLEFALACDLRIAGEGATFSITSSRIGTVAGAGGTQRLPRIVGQAKALEILFGAEMLDAQEALRIGLINWLVPAGAALGKALELATLYGQRAPLSLGLVKKAVRQGMQMDFRSAIDLETYIVSTIYTTEDKREGIAAMLEKRVPVFKGR
ncbi:MAG: enoyl-CoA hydratase/isomerase family protein [SAR324 cluster bacterium]|nr:enoyl-CoA hydratase/isomerase family protein [SAR324 cluster bacterium]MCZ6627723.1 enoyl-CoA hydratase/isomerase family protein [SAR324 cluster bacterium]MCZ6843160.1 enoyl-CoA hydratase/isomerase family protein [SAR324 cluster bacterium]